MFALEGLFCEYELCMQSLSPFDCENNFSMLPRKGNLYLNLGTGIVLLA